jgi:hypothetical protein
VEVQETYDVMTSVLFTVNTLQVSCNGCRIKTLLHLLNTEQAKYVQSINGGLMNKEQTLSTFTVYNPLV